MNRFTKIFLTSALALICLAPIASARPMGGGFHGGFGGRVIVAPGWGWGYGWGPGWYGYGPGWYGPYGYYYSSGTDLGKLKFDTKAKDAMVYVDGGYAGTVGQLKTFPLKAGEHDVELRDPSGHSYYQEHVNVLAGKTLTLNPQSR
jgi:hypothetical protein